MSVESESLKIYRSIVNDEFLESLQASAPLAERRGVFSVAVTVWLMIFQRLSASHGLSSAVEELRQGESRTLLESNASEKRVRSLSSSTGAYSKARNRLSLEVVKQISDRINSALCSTYAKNQHNGRRVFILDGSTLRLSHTPENVKKYPQYKNQHGKAHYPLIRFSLATDAFTGVALRPAYGAYNGSKSTNELELAEDILPRVPDSSIVIADRYYGNARFASTAKLASHDCICRVKENDAKRLIGEPKTKSGEESILWESKKSRTGNEYAVSGRMIWHSIQRKGYRSQKLILFTTLDLPIKEIVKLYAMRWNVELDLRDIKSVLDMDMLFSKTPEMVAKEIVLGITAYNLVRHIMSAVALRLKVRVREISFSKTLARIRAMGTNPKNLQVENIAEAVRCFFDSLSGLKLPAKNKSKPNEPRKTWPKGQRSTIAKSRDEERRKIKQTNKILPK